MMPGIASDGSEDLPNIFTPDPYTHCPFCFQKAKRMAKDMNSTSYCEHGHKWPRSQGLQSLPPDFVRTQAPDENCEYGACEQCGEPGIQRARDLKGTTHCKNGHTWYGIDRFGKKTENKTKPVDTKQNLPDNGDHPDTARLKWLADKMTNSAVLSQYRWYMLGLVKSGTFDPLECIREFVDQKVKETE